MLEELKKIYEDNINWLNYGEVKNGALITLTGVLLGVLKDCVDSVAGQKLLAILCLLAIMISGASFIPFLNSCKFIRDKCHSYFSKKDYYKASITKNVIFYISIFLSTKEEYKKALLSVIPQEEEYCFNRLELNYIEQIYQISTIASIKYYLFSCAVVVLAMTLVVFVGIIIWPLG